MKGFFAATAATILLLSGAAHAMPKGGAPKAPAPKAEPAPPKGYKPDEEHGDGPDGGTPSLPSDPPPPYAVMKLREFDQIAMCGEDTCEMGACTIDVFDTFGCTGSVAPFPGACNTLHNTGNASYEVCGSASILTQFDATPSIFTFSNKGGDTQTCTLQGAPGDGVLCMYQPPAPTTSASPPVHTGPLPPPITKTGDRGGPPLSMPRLNNSAHPAAASGH